MTESRTTSPDRSYGDQRVVIDCAGAIKGGAARFLKELQTYLDEVQPSNVELIGLGRQLTPQWLIKRELIASTATRRIALNNASFVNPRGENITLLRNILQFATADDLEALAFSPPRRLRAQTPVVRFLANASSTLVVPCTRMAEQVEAVAPPLKSKLTVRFHPVKQPSWAGTGPTNPTDVLLPIVPSPYKNLEQHVPEFLNASEELTDEPVRLIVPSAPDVIPEVASHPRVKFIGPQSIGQMEQRWKHSGSVFFPTEYEAFGYALAEARVYGRNVIAQDTTQNREIAGAALLPYQRDRATSLREAIWKATFERPRSDPHPFSPTAYFRWLLRGIESSMDSNEP